MTDKDLTLIAALLDRSGSMDSCKRATDDGFNELINDQRSQPGTALVTLAQFDGHTDPLTGNPAPIPEWNYNNTPIADVPKLDLEPRGMTPLVDATFRFITEIGKGLAALAEDKRPGKVICLIMTDGYENFSHEHDWEQVRNLITQQREKYGWKFMFLGANIDAVEVGASMGIDRGSSVTYDSSSANYTGNVGVYAAASANMSNLRSGLVAEASFTDEDRAAAMGARKDGESEADWKTRLQKKRGATVSTP